MEEWTKEWPNKEGYFWFYGYRYGKDTFANNEEPEFVFCNCFKISNGFLVTGDGQVIYESEPEDYWFMETSLPKPPKEIL